jgi:hypothetical protein
VFIPCTCSCGHTTVLCSSREAWVKTTQHSATQDGGECRMCRLYSCTAQTLFGRITRYITELTSVAKYILQPNEVVQARLAIER